MIEKLQTQCSATVIPMRLKESNKRKKRSQIWRVYFITAEEWNKRKGEKGPTHHTIKNLHNVLAHGTVPLKIAKALLGTYFGKSLNSTLILSVKNSLRSSSLSTAYVTSDYSEKSNAEFLHILFCLGKDLYLVKSH